MAVGIQETKELKSSEFIPLDEFLLVRPKVLETEEKSEFGIIIEKKRSTLDRPVSGTVVSVGSKITDIKPNDYVLWPQTDGIDIMFEDGKFMLLRYTSLIGYKKRA